MNLLFSATHFWFFYFPNEENLKSLIENCSNGFENYKYILYIIISFEFQITFAVQVKHMVHEMRVEIRKENRIFNLLIQFLILKSTGFGRETDITYYVCNENSYIYCV